MKAELDQVIIVANGESRRVTLPCSVADFVAGCGFRPTQVVVEYNGEVLPRSVLGDTQLKEADRLELILPVAGG